MYPGVTIDGVHGTIYCTGSTGVGYFNEVYVSTGSLYIGDNVVLSSPDNQFLNISRPIVVNSATPTFTGGSGAGGAGQFVLTLTGTSVAGSIWLHSIDVSTDDSPIVTVTFNNAYSTEPYVTFSAANTGAAGVYNNVYVETTSQDFSLKLVPGATLINGDVYKWNYNVMG